MNYNTNVPNGVAMTVTTQDILNLANAFSVINATRDLGNGYELNICYRNSILNALKKATSIYLKQSTLPADNPSYGE